MRHRRLILFLLLALFPGFIFAQAKPKTSSKSKRPARPLSPVVVESVQQKKINERLLITGILRPYKTLLLSIEESGRVKQIFKREGDLINKTDVIAIIENQAIKDQITVSNLQIKRDKIELALAKKRLSRSRQLSKKKILPTQQLEDVETNYLLKENRLEMDRAALERLIRKQKSFQVISPFDGQVLRSMINEGQWVTQTNPLVEIVSYDQLELKIGIPAIHLGKIHTGQEVDIRIKERVKAFQGTIKSALQHVDESSGNFTVTILLNNPDSMPLSGLLAEAAVPLGTITKRLLISRDAVIRKSGKTLIAKVENSTVKLVPISIIGTYKSKLIITSPTIKNRDQIVIRGNERLYSGSKVKISSQVSK